MRCHMRKSASSRRCVHWIFIGVMIAFWFVQFILVDKLVPIESYTGPFAARLASPYSHTIAVIHNPSYSWRRGEFIKANSQIQNYQLNWFSNLTEIFPVDCNLSNFIYRRCPTQSEIAHLARHQLAWSWIASLRYPFGLVAEDMAVFVSEESLQKALEQFLTGGLDILGLYAPQRNVIQQEMVQAHGSIVRSDCIPFSSAYVVSRRAARLLSAGNGSQAGAIIDHLCFMAREHKLKVGHVNDINATLVHKRSDFSVLIDGRSWIKQDLSGFHCLPPPEDPSLRASIQIAEIPEHLSFPDVNWPAPIQHRVFINLENNFPSLKMHPWMAQAGAVLTFKPIPGPADWARLTYVLGYEEHYRRGGRGWAERGEELAYWISHCVKKRMELLREINRHASTLSLSRCIADGSRSSSNGYPGCPRNRDVRLGYNEEKHCVYSRSRLALALENSRGEGYMTEKLWLPLLAGAVPVYHGAPDVADWLPAPDAAIDLTSFPSVAEGIAYARRVASDQSLWEQHTAWRARPFSLRFLHALRNSLPNLFCNLDPAQLPLARSRTLP